MADIAVDMPGDVLTVETVPGDGGDGGKPPSETPGRTHNVEGEYPATCLSLAGDV